MPNWRLVLEYDGAGFEGWQRQSEGQRTVQGVLEQALAAILGEPVAVTGAGRTDAGVHAAGQTASARFETRLGAAELQRALNARMPRDLAVRELAPAAEDFHARRAARRKLYRYRVWNGPVRSPLRAPHSHAVFRPLDVPAMQQAAAAFEGPHDFASLQTAGSSVATTRRTLHRVEVQGQAGGEIRIEVEGDGFLRHMVRNLAGTLLEVGLGRRGPDEIPGILAARERSAAGPTAPAQGLCLVRVDYAFPHDSEGLGEGPVDGGDPLG